MDEQPYFERLLSALSNTPSHKAPLKIDRQKSRNAAACMTGLLCNRLAVSGTPADIVSRTTFPWQDGVINVRNAVNSYHWTNLQLSFVKKFHELAQSQPAVYLMSCWQPGDELLHVWSIPEQVMFDVIPTLPIRQTKEKRTILIKPEVQRIEQCDESPILRNYYRSIRLTQHEIEDLTEADKSDRLVRHQRKTDGHGDSNSADDIEENNHAGSESQTDSTTSNAATGKRYWAIGLGEGGRLWNECQEKGIIAIGWDYLGDLRKYPNRDAISQAISTSRGPKEAIPIMASLACHQFVHEMTIGDFVISKIGRSKILGIGTVQSDYLHDSTRAEYRNTRRVQWLRAVNLDLPPKQWISLKTLTDLTAYPKFIEYLRDLIFAELPSENPPAIESPIFTVADAMEGIFLPANQFKAIIDSLVRKKDVILQGPPGVGKTFAALRLAFALMGQKDRNRVSMVQFHQSYSYEDFMQGYRPSKDGLVRRDGIFYDFCNRARIDSTRPFVFIIDEINRGNLSKIFGELMMLIEHDKRGPDHTIPLTYSESSGERFSVPENVHVIGLMNTADRSLAMVDYALRRRFVFFDLNPQFECDAFRAALQERGVPVPMIDRIIERMCELNRHICKDDKSLGRGFEVGHSYFCPPSHSSENVDWEAWYRSVVDWEIAPLLREYWFDDLPRARKLTERLLE